MPCSRSIDRRLLIAVITFAFGLGAFALFHPHSAAAAPCLNCPPPPGGGATSTTVTHTLTVTRPTAGTITSTPSDISCPAGSGGTCSASDSQRVACTDDACDPPDPDAWETYTLSASGGPSGFAASWGGACSGSSCSVKLDDDKTVSMTWVDVTNPSVSVSPGSVKVGRTLNASAAASDNAGIARVEFRLDGALKATDTSAPYSASIAMDGYAQGSAHTLSAWAYDTSGRVSISSSTITVDKVVNLTLGTLPAYTNALTMPLSIDTDTDASMKCSLNGGAASACTGSFSPSLASDGSYTYTVVATDNVGNVASGSRTFIVDRTAPTVSFTDGPFDGAVVGPGDITISFDYSDATPLTVECSVDGGAYGPCSTAHSQTFGSVAPGSLHQLHLRVTDSAGNAKEIVRHFSVTPPVQAGGNNSAGSGAGGSQSLAPRKTIRKAKLSTRFKVKGKNTLVRRLVVTGLPAGARVTLRCKGHGCPFRHRTFKARHGKVDLSKVFKGRKLRKGAKVEIDVAIPGGQKQVFKLTTRAHRKPLQKAG